MHVLINISEDVYTKISNNNPSYADDFPIYYAIKNGKPLPKEYGRLLIVSEDKLKENQINLDFSCQKWISEVGLSNATVATIESDRTESEVQ